MLITENKHLRVLLLTFIALALATIAIVQCSSAPASPAPSSKPAEAPKEAAKPVVKEASKEAAKEPAKVEAKPAAKPVDQPKPGGTLTVGFDIEPESIDPHVGERHQLPALIAPIYDTLVYKSTSGSFVPGLASSWTLSSDGKQYTFNLRSGVKFQDGTPFNAAAVKFNFDRIVNPATESRWAKQLLGPFSSAEVVDDLTVRVTMKEAYGPFLESLAQPYLGMVSPTAVEKWGKQYSSHQVGTGPFAFKEYVPKDHITLVRNSDYKWAPSVVKNQGPAYLDSIVIKFIPESATRRGTVETGETQLVHLIEPRDVARMKTNNSLKVFENSKPARSRHYTLNITKEPTNILEVRQALNVALNRPQIVKTLYGDAYLPAYALLGPGSLFTDKNIEAKYASANGFNVAKAKEMLDKAGWKPGADGIREKDGKPLKIDLAAASMKELHELVKAQLKEVGIDVEIKLTAAPAFFTACGNGEANLCFLGGEAPPDPALHMSNFFAIDGLYNWAKHKEAELDQQIKQGIALADSQKRQQAYSNAQSLIMDKALILPVFYPQDNWAARNEVQGMEFSFLADPVFSDMYIKK